MNKIKTGKATNATSRQRYRGAYFTLRKNGIEFLYPYYDRDPQMDLRRFRMLQTFYQVTGFKKSANRNYETQEQGLQAFYLHLQRLSKSEGWADHYESILVNQVHRIC